MDCGRRCIHNISLNHCNTLSMYKMCKAPFLWLSMSICQGIFFVANFPGIWYYPCLYSCATKKAFFDQGVQFSSAKVVCIYQIVSVCYVLLDVLHIHLGGGWVGLHLVSASERVCLFVSIYDLIFADGPTMCGMFKLPSVSSFQTQVFLICASYFSVQKLSYFHCFPVPIIETDYMHFIFLKKVQISQSTTH